MKLNLILEQILNEKDYMVKGTPFHIYWGGSDIEGRCKWVINIDRENYDVLDALVLDTDQVWCSKREAIETAQEWWEDNKEEWSKKLK
jgi:hypothetical protein